MNNSLFFSLDFEFICNNSDGFAYTLKFSVIMIARVSWFHVRNTVEIHVDFVCAIARACIVPPNGSRRLYDSVFLTFGSFYYYVLSLLVFFLTPPVL